MLLLHLYFIFIFLVFNFNLVLVLADNCALSDESGVDIPWDSLKENELGSFLKTIEVGVPIPGIITKGTSFTKVVASTNCDAKYFNVTQFNASYISVLTNDFSDWDLFKTSSTDGKCGLGIFFDTSSCDNVHATTYTITFIYTVEDFNLQPPQFNAPSYNFQVPFPLGQGLSLTDAFRVLMQTTDLDFSTRAVTYSIKGGSPDFQLDSVPSSNKTFPMSLRTCRNVNLQQPVQLVIVATDDGIKPGPQTSQVIVNIEPDVPNSYPPVPEFSSSLYTESLSLSDLNVGDVIPISVSLIQTYENLTITVDPEEIVKVTLKGKEVTLTLLMNLDPEGPPFQTILLTANIFNGYNLASSSAVVVLDFSTIQTNSSSTSTPSAPNDNDDDIDGEDDDSSIGLLVSTIVLAVIVAILLTVIAFVYRRYVSLKPKIIPTSANNRYDMPVKVIIDNQKKVSMQSRGGEVNKSPGLKPHLNRVRKRSMTFSEDDESSRANRETDVKSGLSEVESSGNDTETKTASSIESITTEDSPTIIRASSQTISDVTSF